MLVLSTKSQPIKYIDHLSILF